MSIDETIIVRVKDLESAAQQIHQAYHQDRPQTWRECPRNVCHLFRVIIDEGRRTYGVTGRSCQ